MILSLLLRPKLYKALVNLASEIIPQKLYWDNELLHFPESNIANL